jgi:hypothetical protein
LYFLKHRGKLLFHGEICDYQSLIPDKELDIKRDKSLVKKLFGGLKRSAASKAEKIRRILSMILRGQRTLPEVLYGAANRALGFLRRGLSKAHKKANTSINHSVIELPPGLEALYTLRGFKGRLGDMFHVLEATGIPEEAGFTQGDRPFLMAHAAMIKRGRRRFVELYRELEENPRLAVLCGFDGYVPSPRSFRRFRARSLPRLIALRDRLVRSLHGLNALSYRVVAIDGKFKRSNTYAYPHLDGFYSDPDAGLCNKGTYKRGPGFMDLKLVDVSSEQPLCSVLFPGNRHETRFLKPLLRDFHRRHGRYPLFLLGDKAFFSFENVLYCIVRGIIPVLDSKKVKAEDLISVRPNHRYRRCYLGKFRGEVLGRLARLRPACERHNSREEDYCQGRLPSRGLERARFWSVMAEIVSLTTYLSGVALRRMDLARCPTAFRRL